MPQTALRSRAVMLACAVLVATSCDNGTTAPSAHVHAHPMASVGSGNSVMAAGLTKAVHAVAARYNSMKQAEKAGYEPDPVCVEAPALGGMGHHWANPSLVDEVFEPTKPEVVLYAPDERGRMRLVAVEYVVIDMGQAAPTFAGQPFDVGGAPIPVPHWTLHVWLYEENPSGLFAPFNPNVDCP